MCNVPLCGQIVAACNLPLPDQMVTACKKPLSEKVVSVCNVALPEQIFAARNLPCLSNFCLLLTPAWVAGPCVLLVPDNKSRNVPEVVVVRRWAVGIWDFGREGVGWVKGGANGVSLQAT